MSRIMLLLGQIDLANAEHRPVKRADFADELVDELRDIFTDARLAEIAEAERDGRVVVLPEWPMRVRTNPKPGVRWWVCGADWEDKTVTLADEGKAALAGKVNE